VGPLSTPIILPTRGPFARRSPDGEIRFQASQILDGDAVGTAVIDRMIGTAVNMLDTYLPHLEIPVEPHDDGPHWVASPATLGT
jgi:hypothetical protein